jgi:hypothetical protein
MLSVVELVETQFSSRSATGAAQPADARQCASAPAHVVR